MTATAILAHAHIPQQALTDFYQRGRFAFGARLAQPLLKAGIGAVHLDLGGDWVPRVLNTASENYFWNAMSNLDVLLHQAEHSGDKSDNGQDAAKWRLARRASDLEQAQQNHQLGIILALGGGRPLEGKPNLNLLSNLRHFYRLGVRVVQLAGYGRNRLADGVAEARTKGRLTYFGKDVVAEMERLGMLIDTAAINDEGFAHICELTRMPLLNSRANCAALSDHPLNLSDARIKALAQRGGVMALSFYADLVAKNRRDPDLADLIRHIDHIADLVGVECIALGGDISGLATPTPTRYERHPGLVNGIRFTERANDYVAGLDSEAGISTILEALAQKNYKEEEIAAIACSNLWRLYKKILPGD